MQIQAHATTFTSHIERRSAMPFSNEVLISYVNIFLKQLQFYVGNKNKNKYTF